MAESRSDKTPHHAGAVNPTIHDPERLQAALRFRESEESFAQSAGPTIADIEEGLAQLADYSQAEPLMRRALAVFQTSLGDEHPNTQTVASNYALLRAACQAEGISLDS